MSSSTLRDSSLISKDLLDERSGKQSSINQEKSKAELGLKFLFEFFDYDIHTFQFISLSGNSQVKVFADEDEALSTCVDYNLNRGFNVFFMVNPGDGVIYPPHKTCRSQDSVTDFAACFIDTDKCPKDKIDAYLSSINLTPHLTVESSPGRFHVYFKLERTPALPENRKKWVAIQQMLHRLGDPGANPADIGTDATMHDYSKVLRVPGFTHVKKQFIATVIQESTHPAYTLADLFALTNAQNYLDHETSLELLGTSEYIPPLPGEKIGVGARYPALQSYAMHIANYNISKEDKAQAFKEFIINHTDITDNEFFYEGKLTVKATNLLSSAISKVNREERQKQNDILKSLEKTKKRKSPFMLPDEFYFSAPNGFGDVVKQACAYSRRPRPALCFGSFLTGLSILKATKYLTPGGSSPALYTLNVAISGFGKNGPMTLLQNLLNDLGYGSLCVNTIRSDVGLKLHMADNNSMAIAIVDEIAQVLRAIQKTDAQSHHANIARDLLIFYTSSAMNNYGTGKTGETDRKKQKELILHNPTLSVLGYTTPDGFRSCFNAASVTQGLFQRFITIESEIKSSPRSPHANKHAIINSPLFEEYRKTAPERELVTVGTDEFDPEEYKKGLNGSATPKRTVSVAPIESSEDEYKPVKKIQVRFTPEAAERYALLEDYYEEQMCEAGNDEFREKWAGLYSRLPEQVERMATVLCKGDTITLSDLEFCIEFLEKGHKAILSIADSTLFSASGGSDGDKALTIEKQIVNTVAEMCSKAETTWISKNLVFKEYAIRKHFKNMTAFDSVIGDLVSLGTLCIKFIKSEKSRSRPVAMLGIGDVL